MIRNVFAFICGAAVVIVCAFPLLSLGHQFCMSPGQALVERLATPQETCLFPLVIHVGPHKTGTTSFQNFLHDNAEWLQRDYGIFVAANETPKEGAYIPCTIKQQHGRATNTQFVNSTRTQELFQIIGRMPENSPVILS